MGYPRPMRFKTGLVVGGVLGYLVAREMARREEPVRSASVQDAMARHPSGLATLAGRAGTMGVEAIQRARASIQRRLEPNVDDLSMN